MNLDAIRTTLSGPMSHPQDFGTLRPAAVLVLICGSPPHVIMTEKPRHMRIHAGEMSFPGGKPEKGDADLCDTALRETREEIGFSVDRGDVIGQLDAVSTLNSKFLILPFVAVLDYIPPMNANDEVRSILSIPLEPFLSTLTPDTAHGPYPEMFALRHQDKIVWGASARILKQVRLRLMGPARGRTGLPGGNLEQGHLQGCGPTRGADGRRG